MQNLQSVSSGVLPGVWDECPFPSQPKYGVARKPSIEAACMAAPATSMDARLGKGTVWIENGGQCWKHTTSTYF